MTTEENKARDRAATVYSGSVPMSGYNYQMEVVAEEDGIMIDEALFVPWEWLDKARSNFATPSLPVAG